MTTEATPPNGAPAPTAPPASPPAAPPATPQPGDENQPWFKERMGRVEQQTREALLKELGAVDLDAAKNAIKAAADAAEAQKTAGQKLGETTKTLETEKARADRLEGVVKERAAHELAGLKPEQQAAVRAIAPDTDPAAQLRAITALTPTWASASAPPAATPPAAPPPATPPSGTAPPPDAPPASGTTSPPDHAAIHAELVKTNPVLAARYATQHAAAIFKA